jgi:hypothetical protein
MLRTRSARAAQVVLVAAGAVALAAVVASAALGRAANHQVGATVASVAEPISTSTAHTSAGCSTPTAIQLAKQFHLGYATMPDPVGTVLCGAFTGPGSQAMVVVLTTGGSIPIWGWAVFRQVGGAWQLALKQPEWGFETLAAAGSDIRQTEPKFRKGDPLCCASGGTETRFWHWNGTRFTAGPWKQVTPGVAPVPAPSIGTGAFKYGYIKTPSGNIQCDYGYGGTARAYLRCGVESGLKPPEPRPAGGCGTDSGYEGNRVYLPSSGRAETAPCAGDAGPFGNPSAARVIAYGTTWSGGGFRCSSAFAGLTCRNRGGHGFFLSRDSWRLF